MKRVLILISISGILFSCGIKKPVQNLDEIAKVIRAYGETTKEPRTIYYKSLNLHQEHYKDWKKEIKNPEKIYIDMYSENYRKKWIATIDSLLNSIPDTSYAEQEKVTDSVNAEFRINAGNLFTPEDIEYMLDQFRHLDVINWKAIDHGSVKITKSKDGTKLALPIFSIDHHLAIIFLTSPGYEGIEVYKKTNGQWEFYFGSTLVIYD